MKRYLITGAAGFIGSKVAQKYIRQNAEVVIVDNLSTGLKENIPEGSIFIEGNVYEDAVLNKIRDEKFDAIIHIAGQSSGEVSFENPLYDLRTNAQSTLQLLEIAKSTGCKHFIYTSSMAVYGEQEDKCVTEDIMPIPKSFYAVGKLASENYMRIFSKFGIQCTALRLFNVYGAGQNMNNMKQGMASIYLAMALRDGHIIVKGSKDRYRDFVYVDDVVQAIDLSLKRKGNDFEVYNVSLGKAQTVEGIINKIKDELGFPIKVEYVEGTPGDMHGIVGDSRKIQKELGWKPMYDFDSGMKKMIEWAKTLNL